MKHFFPGEEKVKKFLILKYFVIHLLMALMQMKTRRDFYDGGKNVEKCLEA